MFTLNCRGTLLTIAEPIVMGIINITPDSFYAGSRQLTLEGTLETAANMLAAGATILDIGAQSTRPGSKPLSEEEELKRVIEPIKIIKEHFPSCILSIDTYYGRVAREAINAGAAIINDISAGSIDSSILAVAASTHTPYVLMHMQGTPQTMQHSTSYENVTRDILDFFIQKKKELQLQGITDIIIDPGFGFGKTIPQNFELLKNLAVYKMLQSPILLGISRKSSIYKTLGSTPEEALNGTTVLNTIGLINGAAILRIHDVKEACEAIKLYRSIYS